MSGGDGFKVFRTVAVKGYLLIYDVVQVRSKSTKVSEEHVASIFRVEE
jgi:hypothetical protein